jgi:hypothetical protein
MRRIKLGKGLLRSLFPSSSNNNGSSKKKKATSKKSNKTSSSNNNNASVYGCPTFLGGVRRRNCQQPYELHQEGASSPPSSSDDESRGHEDLLLSQNNDNNGYGGGDGRTEKCGQQLRDTPAVNQQEEDEREQHDGGDEDKAEANVGSPTTVACTLSDEKVVAEDQDNNEQLQNIVAWKKMIIADKFESDTKVETLVEKEHLKVGGDQLQKDQDTSPSRDEARRRAIARRQRILSSASTRFQAIAETASFDTSEFSSPPHRQLFRRRQKQQQQQQPKREVSIDVHGTLDPPAVSSGLGSQTNKKFSSVVFYDSTQHNAHDISSPTCVAETQYFESGNANKDFVTCDSFNDSNCTSTDANSISFFVLLLCPQNRIFELVEISDAPLHSTVGDILRHIPLHVTDERLLGKKYIGLCRPADRTEFIDLRLPAFHTKNPQMSGDAEEDEDCIPFDYIHESDVLVAILKGSTCYQMSKISKPILRNKKFKEMIRRRRRRFAAANATKKKRRKSSKKKFTNAKSPTNEIYIHDDSSIVSGITCAKPVRSSGQKEDAAREDPASLCKMLEALSKKLHDVDKDEIFLPDDENSSAGSSKRSMNSGRLEKVKRRATVETHSSHEAQCNNIGFKMSPQMLAMELAQTIEDIFADNHVEIVAVDADQDDGNDDAGNFDNDDDSFVTARSHRTKSTAGTLRSLGLQSPVRPKPNVVTQEGNKTKNAFREYKFAETMEENALAAQIEAMAAQADAAFEERPKKGLSQIAGLPAAVEKVETSDNSRSNIGTDNIPAPKAASPSITHNLDESFETTFEVVPDNFLCEDTQEAAIITYGASDKDVMTRKFLTASTSTVTKMVAANQGRVNEVHVLQSLGCTIVCIAANYMSQVRKSGSQLHAPKTSEVLQSAMFLAFMVNGQKYLAKVTQK